MLFFLFPIFSFAQLKKTDLQSGLLKGKVKSITQKRGYFDIGTNNRLWDSTITYYNKKGNIDSIAYFDVKKSYSVTERTNYNYDDPGKIRWTEERIYKYKYSDTAEVSYRNGDKIWLTDSTFSFATYKGKNKKRSESLSVVNIDGSPKKTTTKVYDDSMVIEEHYENTYITNEAETLIKRLTTDLLDEKSGRDTLFIFYAKRDALGNPTEIKYLGEKTNQIICRNYSYYDPVLPTEKGLLQEGKLKNNDLAHARLKGNVKEMNAVTYSDYKELDGRYWVQKSDIKELQKRTYNEAGNLLIEKYEEWIPRYKQAPLHYYNNTRYTYTGDIKAGYKTLDSANNIKDEIPQTIEYTNDSTYSIKYKDRNGAKTLLEYHLNSNYALKKIITKAYGAKDTLDFYRELTFNYTKKDEIQTLITDKKAKKVYGPFIEEMKQRDEYGNPTVKVHSQKGVGGSRNLEVINYSYYDGKPKEEGIQNIVLLDKPGNPENYSEVKNNEYYNPFFNFKISIPKHWFSQTEEVIDSVFKKVENQLTFSQDDQAPAKAVNDGWTDKTLLLLSKYKTTSDTIVNPNITIGYEDVAYQFDNGYGYLSNALTFLKRSNLNVTLDGDIHYHHINWYCFASQQLSKEVQIRKNESITVHQTMYSIFLQNKYAFSIIISYNTDAEKQELEAILKTIQWEYK
ncbi:hypothetical protein DBR32_11260 [Taibaiella sp. KBW10]|nr:hypothetical protein DBR32_11260 [Taibaiella sp. KBW10]